MAQLKKANVEVKENGLVWNWADETITEVSATDFPREILDHAILHGLKQKLADSYSGSVTVREAREAFQGVLDALLAGQWNAGRSSSGGIWVEALAKAAGVSVDEAREKWNSLDEDTQKDVKKNAGVKAAKAEIELERAKAKAKGEGLEGLKGLF